jgi:hypothetical protein
MTRTTKKMRRRKIPVMKQRKRILLSAPPPPRTKTKVNPQARKRMIPSRDLHPLNGLVDDHPSTHVQACLAM